MNQVAARGSQNSRIVRVESGRVVTVPRDGIGSPVPRADTNAKQEYRHLLLAMKKCDLVMKGGITSGIVYPGAVVELAKEFRFVNIGGTSAGAIAAALTAAAEYRRQETGSDESFVALGALPRWLGEKADGRSRLLGLFRPSSETAGLMAVLLSWLETPGTKAAKAFALVRTLAREFPRYGSMLLAIAMIASIAQVSAAWLTREQSAVSIGLVLACLLTIAGAPVGFVLASGIEAILHAFRALPANGFGICTGAGGLTDWLAERIDTLAGSSNPLTFGDLAKHDIHLEVMTTSLTHGRPYRLPFTVGTFYFAPSEMRRLFPEAVVRAMIDGAPRQRRKRVPSTGEELIPFPEAERLPVVVATRMSLSFPVLLSALPLWAVDYGRRDRVTQPERCWFSDGGITSNFPVHFFDAPLPRWPTFAINLAPRSPRYHADEQRVFAPQSNLGGIHEWWAPFDSLPGFLQSILETMQNWRDTMLLRQPGQRDRIAHVLLAEDEGGINLTMEPQVIEDVAQRGREAGATFVRRYPQAWPNHRWVRFRSFMASLEGSLERWSNAFDATLLDGPLPSYKVSMEERRRMRNAAVALHEHLKQQFASRPFQAPAKRPRPEMLLRLMPRE